MEDVEAKITNEAPKKTFFFAWDRSKYRFIGRHVRLALVVLFSFFIAYALLSSMNRIDGQRTSDVAPPNFHSVPTIVLPPSVGLASSSPDGGTRSSRAGRTKVSYTGPQVLYREIAGVPPGTLVKAKLVTGASDGPVRAELIQDVIVNGERLIESGSTILGNGSSTEDRLFIRFDRLVKKDGSTLSIQAQALDRKDRIVGLKGNKVSTEAMKLVAGIGLNFVGGMSDALQETDVKGGVAVRKSSMKNALLNGAAHAALDQSRELISSYKDKAPRIEVEKGRIIEAIWE
jgi:hypothetical protein